MGGMMCSVQGFQESYGQITNYSEVASIVAAIGARDWLGLQHEKIKPRCLHDAGSEGFRLWPGIWGGSIHWFDCRTLQGEIPSNHCDPEDPSSDGGWRRLCKCEALPSSSASTTSAATTTQTTTAESLGVPAGYEIAGSDAMCTDEARTAWNQGIEVGEHPRSWQDDVHSCAERCSATGGCNGFVFWPASAQTRGYCRTYAACDELLCEGCHEYHGSQAFRRLP